MCPGACVLSPLGVTLAGRASGWEEGAGFVPAPPSPSTVMSVPDLCGLALYPFLL